MSDTTGQAKRLWKPVRDQAADSFWLLLIASLSITVMVTRLSGTHRLPAGGDSTYHVAHVLWGGLLLFVAVALPLSLVNRYALWASSILGGIGAGLFIDEVGNSSRRATITSFRWRFRSSMGLS
ncbi:MAG: hypothetical protein IPK16_18660 [Anaerolineales bacterium]|nr:hypothetical protein [Anaerolineales bacterium]